ncbi:MAG: hypothetical protein MJD61_08450 [Proteobacteria bacterium]|nr:hypothetical protein [Pseudomonadota bacterium]
MSAWNRHWYGSVAALRPYLLRKGILILLAFDTWVLMVRHAGRYGAGGFNVAHFGWLDALHPVPTPDWYVGMLTLSAFLALAMALAGETTVGMLGLFALYTYSWSMSMLDSYQHHYLLSLMLLCLALFPRIGAEGLLSPLRQSSHAAPGQLRCTESGPRSILPRATQAWLYTGVAAAVVVLLLTVGRSSGSWLWLGGGIVVIVVTAVFCARSGEVCVLALTGAWAYRLLLTIVAVVYGYAAIAKIDTMWREGHTFRSIGDSDRLLEPVARFVAGFGFSEASFWELAATGVVAGEVALAFGYALAVYRDQYDRPWLQACSWATWVLALGLHVTIELIDLSIGWFSYYMSWAACVCLLPVRWLHVLTLAITWPARQALALLGRWDRDESTHKESPIVGFMLALAVAGLALWTGWSIDLPGVFGATLLVGLGLLVRAAVALHSTRQRTLLRRYLLSTGLSAALLWLAVARGSVRFDYYRFVGSDLRHRGELEAALEAYVKADRHAPEGKSRRKQIDKLKRLLAR